MRTSIQKEVKIMKSVFGLDENIAAALSYILGPFSGIAVLIMERENKFVRFHALQSTIWFVFLMVAGWVLRFAGAVLGAIPILGWFVGIVLGSALFVGSVLYVASKIYLMLKAYGGVTFKLPIIGEVVWNQVNG